MLKIFCKKKLESFVIGIKYIRKDWQLKILSGTEEKK